MKKQTKRKLIHTILASILWLAVYLIPAFVVLEIWDLSSKTLAWMFIVLLVLLGSERLYALIKTNNIWSYKKK